VRFGGGGHRDPWATLAVGDLAFVGDEAFVNVCRPVLIGREVYLTMRSLIVTHNIGHSILEGFENRFASVVLEDRSQVRFGAVLYAGPRVGRESIVRVEARTSSSEIPARNRSAIGVPAKVSRAARATSSQTPGQRRARVALRRRPARAASRCAGHPVVRHRGRGFEAGNARSRFAPRATSGGVDWPSLDVLSLDVRGDVPTRRVIDLLARQVHGGGGVVLDSVREFCRKRGIKLEPGPWSYPRRLDLERRLHPLRDSRNHPGNWFLLVLGSARSRGRGSKVRQGGA
jgi:carbonic anhydrase/acetyltransferase-like protein (isoleucine patch superfamily)